MFSDVDLFLTQNVRPKHSGNKVRTGHRSKDQESFQRCNHNFPQKECLSHAQNIISSYDLTYIICFMDIMGQLYAMHLMYR